MSRPVSIPDLFRFWLPLQATWLMMALEGPFLAAVIARLAEPKHNLAAYGVAFALAILVEAPVIMMMSASTALVDSAGIYRRLRHFMWMLNGGITAVMLLLLLTPLWSLLTDNGHEPRSRGGPPGPHLHVHHAALAGGHRLPALLPGSADPRGPDPPRGLGHGGASDDHGRDRPVLCRGDRPARRLGGRHRPVGRRDASRRSPAG